MKGNLVEAWTIQRKHEEPSSCVCEAEIVAEDIYYDCVEDNPEYKNVTVEKLGVEGDLYCCTWYEFHVIDGCDVLEIIPLNE